MRLYRPLLSATFVLWMSVSSVQALETEAKQAIITDYDTHAVLLSKEADTVMYPASMTKMMTVYLLFNALKAGEVTLDSTFHVNESAWSMGGSKMFVELGNDIRVEDLIQGIVVQSGNDACIVVAEGLAGSEAAFAELMNDQAAKLGMQDTHFKNSTGWPDEEHVTSAHDLAILATALIRDFPDYYHYFAEPEFTYHDIKQYNRNILLGRNIGVDGLKTGHTEASGYGITVSAKQNDRRVVVVINGLGSEKGRADEAASLVNYGFGSFSNLTVAKAGDVITELPVWMGEKDTVALTLPEDAFVTLPKAGRSETQFSVTAVTPVATPVEAGQTLGTLTITGKDMPAQEFPLVAAETVGSAGFVSKALKNLYLLLQ